MTEVASGRGRWCLLPDRRRSDVRERAFLLVPGHGEEVQCILRAGASLTPHGEFLKSLQGPGWGAPQLYQKRTESTTLRSSYKLPWPPGAPPAVLSRWTSCSVFPPPLHSAPDSCAASTTTVPRAPRRLTCLPASGKQGTAGAATIPPRCDRGPRPGSLPRTPRGAPTAPRSLRAGGAWCRYGRRPGACGASASAGTGP